MPDSIILTERELYVFKKLKERVQKITGGQTPGANLVRSIVIMCSVWNFPVLFKDDDPKEIVIICKSLIEKGFLKEYEDNMMPSFVPIGSTKIVEYKYRDFTQDDVI